MTDTRRSEFATCQPVLEVRDIREAVQYYRDTLGFELDFEVGDPAECTCVSREGWSQGAPASIRFTNWLRDKPQVSNGGWLNIFMEEGLDRLYEELVARGVDVSWEIGKSPVGHAGV